MSDDNLMVCFDDGFTKKEERVVVQAIKRKLHTHTDVESVPTKKTKLKNAVINSPKADGDKVQGKYNNQELPTIREKIEDVTKYISLDCEFVGVGPRKLSALGRCSIVDFNNKVLLDIYARPEDKITDYRTPWSGIRPRDMRNAIPFEFARNTIKNILKDKILIGHALFNDLSVLKIQHPPEDVRDTAKCCILKKLAGYPENGSPVGLKKLANILLGRAIQKKWHCSVEDAKATMDLFKFSRNEKLKSTNTTSHKGHTPKPDPHGTSSHASGAFSTGSRSSGEIHTNGQLEKSHTRNVPQRTFKRKTERRLSWGSHPYFEDEFWPKDY